MTPPTTKPGILKSPRSLGKERPVTPPRAFARSVWELDKAFDSPSWSPSKGVRVGTKRTCWEKPAPLSEEPKQQKQWIGDGGRGVESPYYRSDWEIGGPKPEQRKVQNTITEEGLRKQAEEEVREGPVRGQEGEICPASGGERRGRQRHPAKRKERPRKERQGKRQRWKAQERKAERKREGKEQEQVPSKGDWQRWKEELKGSGETPGSMRLWTVRVVRHLHGLPSGIGPSLRRATLSPNGGGGIQGKTCKALVYPLPLPAAAREAFRSILDVSEWSKRKPKQQWGLCKEAWWGLLVVGLNMASGFTSFTTSSASECQKKVLELLWEDAVNFVNGDSVKGPNVVRPVTPWKEKLPGLSINYTGDVVEKAKWLTGAQVIPGLPPEGFGGSLEAAEFCSPWVRRHLEDPSLTRLDDSEVAGELPSATVHATQEEWEKIAVQLVQRGVAVVLEEEEIELFRGQPILNGAFGVTKPNKFVDVDGVEKPVLRLIMDFRATNSVHRMLPGSVDSLVGPAKWQAIILGDKQTLVTSGDDLVSCFYLFKVPRAWSRYFAFRKQVSKAALGLQAPEGSMAYVASAVLPMGWAAAVTVMQHIHRSLALQEEGLPEDREVHRGRALPEVAVNGASNLWNLYIDDFTSLEVLQEETFLLSKEGKGVKNALQQSMQGLYKKAGVPFSSEKSSIREPVTETLGALVDGSRGVLGVSTHRALDLISLGLHLMSLEKVPVKWLQVYLGKFVHVLQFRRPLFGLVKYLWKRLQYFGVGRGLGPNEVQEIFVLICTLPLCYTDLRAVLSSKVTASDASEWGGGLCVTTGVTALGRMRLGVSRCRQTPRVVGPFIAIEWFAGIGGLGRALHRLGLIPLHTVVCEQDKYCLHILQRIYPGATVWKDILKVTRQDIRGVLNSHPEAQGVIQAGGSPCQGLSQLSSSRQHFDDPRSGLFYSLADLQKVVQEECSLRGMWHLGLVENVVCDESDQKVFRDLTGWSQYLMCSGTLSHVRRPRFFWSSEPLSPLGEGEMEDHGGYYELRVFGPKEPPALWECPGCQA